MNAARYIYLLAIGLVPICLSAQQEFEPKPPSVVPGEVLLEVRELGAANGNVKLPSNLSKISSGVFSFRSTGYADGATAVPLDKKALATNCKFAESRLIKSGIVAKVESCEPNYVVEASKTVNDSYAPKYQEYSLGHPRIFDAWDITQGSKDIIVAVIDTGVDYKHPDLADNMFQNPGEISGNKIDDDKNGYVDDVYGYDFANNDADPMDGNGHGTHCAGTIGAVGNNMLGVAGVNWNVRMMALKFLGDDGSGTTANAIKAINYAVANGAKVLSNSWGALLAYSRALENAIKMAQAAGVIFVAAAGNDALNNDKYPTYPASYKLLNIVSVAAIDPVNGSLASFSNFGAQTVHIAAPGVNILGTSPGGAYAFMSGTSMATPHVAGVLALMLSLKPDAGYEVLKQTLLDSTQFSKQLWNIVGTSGSLDAYAAVKPFAPAEAPPEDSSSGSSGSDGAPGESEPDDDSSSDDESVPFEYVLLAGRATAKGNIVNGQATRKVGIEALASGESNRTDNFTLELQTGDHSCELVSDKPISSGASISEFVNLPQIGFRATFDILLTSASGGEALTSFKANLCRLGRRCQTELSTAQFKRICAIFQNKLSD